MILIADSGSTKTDWRVIDRDGTIHQFQTIGLHPFFVSDELILQSLQMAILPAFPAALIREVYFYGSGLSSQKEKQRFQRFFSDLYQLAKVEIHHDLLGAARALCGDESGVALILGTGANSCTYHHGEITANMSSSGYILGDEGSGADLGKRWAHAFITERAPENLRNSFVQKFGADKELILDRVYKGERPNRFLASFCPFLKENIKDPFIANLVDQAFEELIQGYLKHYKIDPSWKIHATGSIAHNFSSILGNALERHGLHLGNVVQKPIAALALYHSPE
ncbi:MAG: hypothetical protein P8O05_02910 [Flavobacteriales bacterium]|nr:hypothetical protein [Flavobacteriales bacterium]